MKRVLADPQLNFLVAVNVLVIGVATLSSGGTFINLYNMQSMASQMPELGLLGLGVMLAMVSGNGGIDLSGISLANLGAMLAVMLAPHIAVPDTSPVLYTLAFIAISVATGALGGMLNGVLISRFGLTPILCTLGTQLLFMGMAVVLSNGSAVRLPYVPLMDSIGNDAVFGVPNTWQKVIVGAFILVAGAFFAVRRAR